MEITNPAEDQALQALSALSQSHRLRVFRELVGAGPSGLTPGQLAQRMEIAAPTLSFHLKELLYAGLVTQRRDGRHLIYGASFDRVNELIAYLTAHCCRSTPCEQAPAGACVC